MARSLPYASHVMLRILARAPLAALLFLTACGAAPITPVTVSLTDAGLQVPPAHRAAVEEIVTIMRQQLSLPVPERVSVFVYDSRASFREGLMDEGYVPADRVNEIASFAAGLARPGRVLLHAKATRGRLEWRRLIAHELTHVVQFNLARGGGRADQWLGEGRAGRGGWRGGGAPGCGVGGRRGTDPAAGRRGGARVGARKHPGFVNDRLDLAAL